MRHEARRSASSTSDQVSPKRGFSPLTSTGCTTPSKDTNSHSLPLRTAFSVTGSFWGSKNGSLRSSPASPPSSFSVTLSAAPLPHSMRKLPAHAARVVRLREVDLAVIGREERRDDEADPGGAGAYRAEEPPRVGVEEGRAVEDDVAQPEPVRPGPLRQRHHPADRLRLRGERGAGREEPGGERTEQWTSWRRSLHRPIPGGRIAAPYSTVGPRAARLCLCLLVRRPRGSAGAAVRP